jgi:hypothetical protein
MCDPVTIAVGIAVATTAVSVVGQIQSANAANAAIKAQAKVEEKQIDQQATQDIDNRLRQARRDMGRIMVAAGESGLNLESGSVKALEEDAAMQASLDNEQSLATKEAKKQAVVADANSKMVSKPTILGAGLQIGLAGLNAAEGAGAFKGSPKPAAGD